MEPSFEKLLAHLTEARIEFIVVGGAAVTFQGYARLTEDLDILIDRSSDNITRLLSSLTGYGEGYARELSLDDFSGQEGAVRIVEETERMQIDIFTQMSGRTYEDVMKEADSFVVGGATILVASKQSLIAWKKTSHREKDQLDAQALSLLQNDPHAFD